MSDAVDRLSWAEIRRLAYGHRKALRGFLDAQQELHEIQESIQRHVSKTLELGRLPEPADLEEGSCGHGCGCHH